MEVNTWFHSRLSGMRETGSIAS